MTTTVHESMGSTRNTAVDDALFFPNAQTCIAVWPWPAARGAGVAIPITSFQP
ncbi:hypothetical protein [Sorangium sp. So ce388]|uniref:hypothetical protein n=1 Tax=Sorangium sp. So ce388 TaxID=3133309 RepID=UPI003F5B5F94